jgi:hypothetical protein
MEDTYAGRQKSNCFFCDSNAKSLSMFGKPWKLHLIQQSMCYKKAYFKANAKAGRAKTFPAIKCQTMKNSVLVNVLA